MCSLENRNSATAPKCKSVGSLAKLLTRFNARPVLTVSDPSPALVGLFVWSANIAPRIGESWTRCTPARTNLRQGKTLFFGRGPAKGHCHRERQDWAVQESCQTTRCMGALPGSEGVLIRQG